MSESANTPTEGATGASTSDDTVDSPDVDSDAIDEALASDPSDGDGGPGDDGADGKVELHVDEEKMAAWDAIKDDYAVDVEGGPSADATPTSPGDPDSTQDAPG